MSYMLSQREYSFQMAERVTGNPWEKPRAFTVISLMLYFPFEDDTDTAVRSGGGQL